jgi:predicted acyltransferase
MAAVIPTRVSSVDVYRGFVMFLMMAEVLEFGHVSKALPESSFWAFLAFHQDHVEWVGCSLHDLIQPSFSFLVGVALPYSIASRLAKGQSFGAMFGHTVQRSLILIFLGIFLRSMHREQTNFTFEDTLTQIGLGYPVLFWLGFRSFRTQLITLCTILVGYWLAFALYPLPGPDFDYAAVGVTPDWEHNLKGFAAHWNKNTNLAWAFDQWFLNLFPREKLFLRNGGGYATLSFIPTLGTMILGLLAGNWLKNEEAPKEKLKRFATVGVALLAAGWLINWLGIGPNVKRIWTPTWVIFSGGWCFVLLAAFYWMVDIKNYKKAFFWLMVIGMNSIAAYVISHTIVEFIHHSFQIHMSKTYDQGLGEAYASLIRGGVILFTEWLILYWMNRNRIFIRI